VYYTCNCKFKASLGSIATPGQQLQYNFTPRAVGTSPPLPHSHPTSPPKTVHHI
jgi:hypothetical protein